MKTINAIARICCFIGFLVYWASGMIINYCQGNPPDRIYCLLMAVFFIVCYEKAEKNE